MRQFGRLSPHIIDEMTEALRDRNKSRLESLISRETGSAQATPVNEEAYQHARGVASQDYIGKIQEAIEKMFPKK